MQFAASIRVYILQQISCAIPSSKRNHLSRLIPNDALLVDPEEEDKIPWRGTTVVSTRNRNPNILRHLKFLRSHDTPSTHFQKLQFYLSDLSLSVAVILWQSKASNLRSPSPKQKATWKPSQEEKRDQDAAAEPCFLGTQTLLLGSTTDLKDSRHSCHASHTPSVLSLSVSEHHLLCSTSSLRQAFCRWNKERKSLQQRTN